VSGAKGHHDFFERAVAGSLAKAVDCALDLPGPSLDRCETVRHGEPKVVMAVNADDCLVDVGDAINEVPHDAGVVGRRGVANRIRDVNCCGADGDGRLHDATEEVRLRPCCILRGELDVVAVAAGPLNAGDGPLDDLLLGHAKLEFAMDGAGRKKYVNPRVRSFLKRLAGTVDILVVAPCKAADCRAAHRAGNSLHRLEVAWRGDGKSRLDHVDAQIHQRLGHFELLFVVHAAARRLLAVAERRVENDDAA
jgi:hypothetical protein